jgi:hypothetical protein
MFMFNLNRRFPKLPEPVQKSGQRTPLTSEFLEAAKLEGNNSAVNRLAEQRYLKLALDAWEALARYFSGDLHGLSLQGK